MEFCVLTIEDSLEAFNVIMQANLNTFPLLIHKYQSLESFEEETRGTISVCFATQQKYRKILNKEIQYNYGIKQDGKLIAVMLSLDMVEEYSLMQPFIGKNQFETAFTHFNLESLEPGKVVYFTRLSVLPSFSGKGIGKKLVYLISKELSKQGYESSIMGSIVEPSYHMFMKLGGQLMRHQEAIRPNFTYQINIIKNNFDRLFLAYEKPKIIKQE